MIVTLDADAHPEAVRRALVDRGLWIRSLHDTGARERVLLAVTAGSAAVAPAELLALDGVAAVAAPAATHPLLDGQPATVEVDGTLIGPSAAAPVLMAGPCSVESPEQIEGIATRLAGLGVRFLRGGAFKPRTSPYSFQGHGEPALGWLRDAARAHRMLVVTEAVGVEEVEPVAAVADLIQIGSRNMSHAPLLRAAGATGKPILLKRGLAATIDEWLLAGECCLLHGAAAVLFCERGLRGFDRSTRHLLDLGAVALLAHVHRLPVIVDPSHGAGRRDLIAPLSRAGLAAGAAGLMLETHDDPGRALSDGPQALSAEEIASLVAEVRAMSGRGEDDV